MIKRTKEKFEGFEQLDSKSLPIVFDKRLLELVLEKKEMINNLKTCKKDIAENQHKVEDLQRYIAAIEMIDNYDLEDCRNLAMEKLDVIK